jgi:ABC-type antimicrobial peptide transport system permease subunit
MALGARPGDVLRLVLGQSLRWSAGGLAVGLVAAVAMTRMLGSLLYGVTPTEPIVLGLVSLVLVTVTVVASAIPARRAVRVDPLKTLRYE